MVSTMLGIAVFLVKELIAVAFSGVICAHKVAADLRKQILDKFIKSQRHIKNK